MLALELDVSWLNVMDGIIHRYISIKHYADTSDAQLNNFIIEANDKASTLSASFRVEINVPDEELAFWTKMVLGWKSLYTDTELTPSPSIMASYITKSIRIYADKDEIERMKLIS